MYVGGKSRRRLLKVFWCVVANVIANVYAQIENEEHSVRCRSSVNLSLLCECV